VTSPTPTKVIVDSMAWVRKSDLAEVQLEALRRNLTLIPKAGPYGDAPAPILLYQENAEWFGMARAYYLARRQPHHEVEFRCRPGAAWPEGLTWNPEVTLRPEQQRALDEVTTAFRGGVLGGIVRAAPGWGKCAVSSTSFVDSTTGRRETMGASVGRPVVVPSLTPEGRIEHRSVERVWYAGKKPCLRMVLASGQNFGGSEDHPVLTASGYKALSSLRVGELVATARSVPAPEGAPSLTDAEVLLSAALLMDGSTNHTSTIYCKGDPILTATVRAAAIEVGGPDTIGREWFDQGAYYLGLCGLIPWSARHDLRGLSKTKRVPAHFFGLGDAQLALFLRWVYTDGNVYAKAPRKVELSMASEGFIDDVQYLLRRFGIVARKTYAPKSIKNKVTGEKKFYPAWRLQIADAPNLVRFLEAIGPVPGKEAACVEVLQHARGVSSNPNWDVVPVGSKELAEIRAQDRTGVWARVKAAAGSYIGRDRFLRLCKSSGYDGSYRSFADADIVWEKVKSLEDLGVQDVYDLTVPGTENAVVNAGVVIHNTVYSLRLIAELKVPTLVVVHKEFLADQWLERIHGNPKKGLKPLLLGAKVGIARGDQLDFKGKHIVIGMVHTLASKDFPLEFLHWPGLILPDECHRIAAPTWSPTPGRFPARWRLGVSATPRRKDGAERVFLDHLGPVIFKGEEQRLPFRVRRVWTGYKPPKGGHAHLSGPAGKVMLLTIMLANAARNGVIVEQLVAAIRAGRKVIVLSERLDHLDRLDQLLLAAWTGDWGPLPTTGRYVGGMTSEDREVSEGKQVIFATFQYAAEGLDIPPLDTLFLVSPASDVEQAVGRIRRPYEGKKEAVVVDFRDENVSFCARAADARDKFYRKSGVV